MKATFTEVSYHRIPPKVKSQKTIYLPFARVSARALIVRRQDGAVFGVRHLPGRGMALPGGGLNDGETPAAAVIRELTEEKISLITPDEDWQERFGIDYFAGYQELNFWFLIAVDDVRTAPSPEIHEWTWVAQHEDPWYPGMRTLILHFIEKYLPQYLSAT